MALFSLNHDMTYHDSIIHSITLPDAFITCQKDICMTENTIYPHVGSKNTIICMFRWKSLDKKHVDRNSILVSQTQSVFTFSVDMSQWKQSVTTSDTEVELIAITMKPCQMCHSMVMCINTHYWLVLI